MPYEISAEFPVGSPTALRIEEAVLEFNRRSHVHFRDIRAFERRPEDFVCFVRIPSHEEAEADSQVACVGGRQDIRIRLLPSIATLLHEMHHAIGLLHEHQRPDRDEHVLVRTEVMTNTQAQQYACIGESEQWPEGIMLTLPGST